MEGLKKFVVSRDDSIYEAWPDLTLTPSGKLICTFTECTYHTSRDLSRIMITESLDRGRTWSQKRPFTEMTNGDSYFNNSRVSVLNDGRIAVVCDRVDGDENYASQIWIWLSEDDGNTWGEPKVYPFCGIVPDKLKQLKTGRIILAAHHKNHETGKIEQYLWYSDDNMENWSERIIVASDARYNLCEASILECHDGTLVAFMRENSLDGIDCLKTISYDNGETWSEVYRSNLPGCHRPVSGFLPDGNVLISYRFITGGIRPYAFVSQNTFFAICNEESVKATDRRKQGYRIVPLDYDRSYTADTGYTGWVAFPDGEIYMVNYIVDDAPKAQIRGYSFYTDSLLVKQEGEEK
ncbi:MAG: exo-alpha-sialidase [Ruminococcaceae bacterium]|nr:exo-alpha-sialidase [Oscillospiraceae bacterium]